MHAHGHVQLRTRVHEHGVAQHLLQLVVHTHAHTYTHGNTVCTYGRKTGYGHTCTCKQALPTAGTSVPCMPQRPGCSYMVRVHTVHTLCTHCARTRTHACIRSYTHTRMHTHVHVYAQKQVQNMHMHTRTRVTGSCMWGCTSCTRRTC